MPESRSTRPQTCISEISSLHTWFSDWFAGRIPAARIDRFVDVLAADFHLIDPSGRVVDRGNIIDAIQTNHGGREVEISIEDASLLWQRDAITAITYTEIQQASEVRTSRRSTAVFEHTDAGPLWLSVHETWIDG